MTIRRKQCKDLVSLNCGDFSPYAPCRMKQCLLSKHLTFLMFWDILCGHCHEERLGELGLLSLEKWRSREILLMTINAWREGEEDGARFLFVVPSARTRGKGHKLAHRRFLSEHQDVIFLLCISALETSCLKRCETTSLEIFKAIWMWSWRSRCSVSA